MSISFRERRKGITSESHIALTLWRLVESRLAHDDTGRARQEGGVGAELASGKANGAKSPHLTGDRERRRAANKRCEGGWGNYKGGGVRVREGGGGNGRERGGEGGEGGEKRTRAAATGRERGDEGG